MIFSERDDITYELERANSRLAERELHLDLVLVNGTSLFMKRLISYGIYDEDTKATIESEVEDLLSELSVDINDYVSDESEVHPSREYLIEEEMNFSNITIEYMSFPGIIITKMQNIDNEDDKDDLICELEQDYGLQNISQDSIIELLTRLGYEPNDTDLYAINRFVTVYGNMENI